MCIFAADGLAPRRAWLARRFAQEITRCRLPLRLACPGARQRLLPLTRTPARCAIGRRHTVLQVSKG